MRNLNDRWKEAARHARQAPPRDDQAPPGFASRVTARSRKSPAAPSLELIWQRLCLGTLAAVTAILGACAVSEWPHLRERQTLQPNIEDTVAQVLDRL